SFEMLACGKVPPKSHVAAWLHSVATNRSLDKLKTAARRKRREHEYGAILHTHASIEWNDLYEHIDRLIADLPEDLRAPLVAHYLQGRTHAELAEEMNLSRPAVTRRIRRAVEHLRAGL